MVTSFMTTSLKSEEDFTRARPARVRHGDAGSSANTMICIWPGHGRDRVGREDVDDGPAAGASRPVLAPRRVMPSPGETISATTGRGRSPPW